MLFHFNNITYTLGAGEKRTVRVSGCVGDGQVMVVRGPSGSGKTTLLRILARLQTCTVGDVYLKGRSWSVISGAVWRTRVHLLSQKTVLFEGTVAENLAMPFVTRVLANKKSNINLAEKYMAKLLLAPGLLEQDARVLSGGEAARIAFIRALLIDPDVLLLDEPTAALDERAREAFYGVLSGWLDRPGRAAILVSHNMDYEILGNIEYLDIAPRLKG